MTTQHFSTIGFFSAISRNNFLLAKSSSIKPVSIKRATSQTHINLLCIKTRIWHPMCFFWIRYNYPRFISAFKVWSYVISPSVCTNSMEEKNFLGLGNKLHNWIKLRERLAIRETNIYWHISTRWPPFLTLLLAHYITSNYGLVFYVPSLYNTLGNYIKHHSHALTFTIVQRQGNIRKLNHDT